MSLTAHLKQSALDLGFDLVGVASSQDPMLAPAIERYSKWIEGGHHATMDYLRRHTELKANPEKLLTGWKSVLCVALSYGEAPPSEDGTRAQVSLYTRGQDYHLLMSEKLTALATALSKEHGVSARPFVDSEPVMDRFWAWRAGLGWLAKNTCLINRKMGSFLFLGGLLTTAELEADGPQPDHCGKCRKCIDACPTHALTEDRYLESEKCIAYHTIENKGVVPEPVMRVSGRWVAGCDICQTVCPWNDPVTVGPAFQSTNPVYHAPLVELAQWDAAKFKNETAHVAMGRMKYAAFLRNLAIAISNSELDVQSKKESLAKISTRIEAVADSAGKAGARVAVEWGMKNL